MAKVIFGNHMSVIVPLQDRDSIRNFYCDVLGGTITKGESDRDFVRLGDDFYVFLYGDVPDENEFQRTARSVCTASDFSSHSARNYWTASLVWINYQSFGIPACFRRYWRDEDARLTSG